MKNFKQILSKAAKIKLLALDVDGVLTDGKIYLSDNGSESKCFCTRDGIGLKMLLKNGIEVAIITGRYSKALEHRMNQLGVKYVFQNQEDKTIAFAAIKKSLKLKNEQVAYIGDDSPDIPVLQEVGLSITVFDAHESVYKEVDYITTQAGGVGAVREVCDLILTAKKLL
jgi:3-deoxy-D-manno-octulosonate 8-phosphate phosphatase (KDO 8-P phosphatase)